MGDIHGEEIHRNTAHDGAGDIAVPQHGGIRKRAHQSVCISGVHGGQARNRLGRPGAFIPHRLACGHFADLDHRQGQAQHRLTRVKRASAIKADARSGQFKVILAAKQDAPGRRKRPRNASIVGQGVELGQLGGIHRMVGVVGTGEVRHQKLRARLQQDPRYGFPFRSLQPKAVHPGIDMHGKGVLGQGF